MVDTIFEWVWTIRCLVNDLQSSEEIVWIGCPVVLEQGSINRGQVCVKELDCDRTTVNLSKGRYQVLSYPGLFHSSLVKDVSSISERTRLDQLKVDCIARVDKE